ncbi:MAG: GAF domain-containing protein [Bacteroidales bacterium]
MDLNFLDKLKLKVRFSIIIVFMVTFTMILISFLVYFSRKDSTFDLTEKNINKQLEDLSQIIEIKLDENNNEDFDEIRDIINNKSYQKNGFAFLMDNRGNWISPPPNNFSDYFSQQTISLILRNPGNKINRDGSIGNALIFIEHVNNDDLILGITVFEKDFWYPTRSRTFLLIIIGISGGIILFTFLLHFLMRTITTHLTKLSSNINTLSTGVFPDYMHLKRKDEIGAIANSVNKLIDGLKKTAEFAVEIGKGNYDFDYKPLSENDVLGNSLIETKNNLKEAKEEERIRKIEEEDRNWTAQGLAEFSDILRMDYNNISELAFKIIQKLIKFLDINQGGLFIVNDDDPNDIYLELIACYAYDRQKFVTMKIKPGESLVGACYLERKTSYLKSIPETYTSITSGLGDAGPTSLLLSPLAVNDEIYGVIELASFSEFSKLKIEFVEKIAESIASALSNAKTNEKTKQLLEQSRDQAEQMRVQEEEMKQNMEEMQSTQEEMQRLLALNNLRIEQAKALSNVREICQDTIAKPKDILDKISKIITKSWQHADYAAIKIAYDNIEILTPGYKDTPWKLSETLNINNKYLTLEVVYTKEMPEADHGPFLNEEIELLKNIAAIIKAYLLEKI